MNFENIKYLSSFRRIICATDIREVLFEKNRTVKMENLKDAVTLKVLKSMTS